MKQLLLMIGLVFALQANAQSFEQFNIERNQTDQRLMIGLGTWATTNFIASGIGWASVPKGQAHYFHQMNVMWNTINMGLAIPGYLKAKKANSSLSFAETIRTQHQTEKIFLINSGLDIGYMAGGLLLRSSAKTNVSKQDQFNGYGNSLLLQGGFLFLFDLTAYIIHNHHSKKSLDNLLNSVQLSSSGFGIQWNLDSRSLSSNKRILLAN
jgi:sRNA-binding regulator protein Hfq